MIRSSACLMIHIYLMQGTDIPVLEAPPLLQAHAHLRGVWLRTTHVALYIEYTTIRARMVKNVRE